MVVQHNMQAANASRMLNITTSQQGKSTEKLSSGYRINRAADDAAGLSISEKMRRQIKGLAQASTNASDGVSAVQTAEGALNEVHSMLQRMNELAVQAANGTNDESDRQDIQNEIEQLTQEIDRISQTTRFNESYLLKGNGIKSEHLINAHDAGLEGTLTVMDNGTTSFQLFDLPKDGDTVTVAGKDYVIGKEYSPADYVDLAAAKALPVSAGDYITVNTATSSSTYNLTDDVPAAFAAENGDIITDADGNKYKYDNTTSNWVDMKTGQNAITGMIKIAGSTLRRHDEAITRNIVSALRDDQVSTDALTALTVDKFAAAKTLTIGQGTEISIAGNSVFVTATGYDAVQFEDVKDLVNALAKDDTVKITDKVGTNPVTYKVVEDDDLVNLTGTVKLVTRDMIINKLVEGAQVTITNAGVASNLTVAGVTTPEEGAKSVNEIYKLMAEELQKASSIGTTEREAEVVNYNNGTFLIKQGSVVYSDPYQFNLHVGAEADMTNKIVVDVEPMNATSLGVKGITIADDTGMNATYAIDVIADALNKVSAQRAELGAVQNRLEHSIANLDNVVENTEASESRIRDTDMADEMVKYSKNNILSQAGQSMLAQANQATQGVLSLLQ